MNTASWIAEPDEPLPSPYVDGDEPVRLVTCVECGRRAANPPGRLGECRCGGETVEHEIDRQRYSELRWYGSVQEEEDV